MEAVIQFIKENWQYLSIALVILFDIVFLIFKKRPMSIDEFEDASNYVLQAVPILVGKIEESVGSGQGDLKKQLVVDKCLKMLEHKLHRELTKVEEEMTIESVCTQVERVLEAPQKKGV